MTTANQTRIDGHEAAWCGFWRMNASTIRAAARAGNVPREKGRSIGSKGLAKLRHAASKKSRIAKIRDEEVTWNTREISRLDAGAPGHRSASEPGTGVSAKRISPNQTDLRKQP